MHSDKPPKMLKPFVGPAPPDQLIMGPWQWPADESIRPHPPSTLAITIPCHIEIYLTL